MVELRARHVLVQALPHHPIHADARAARRAGDGQGGGRYERVLAKHKKHECLVVDEFMLNVATKEETRDLYELVEGRSQIHSTIFCSQYQEVGWLERLGRGTSAEGSSTASATTPTASR